MAGGVFGWLMLALLCTVAVLVLQRVIVHVASGESKARRILVTGQPAIAVVLDAHDTGRRVDAIFVLTRLRLRVQSSERLAPFDAEVTVPISRVKLAEFASGRAIRVRVDPDTREVAIDQERQ